MAKAAKAGNVAADMRPADYRAAIKRLATIDNKKTAQQKLAKEIGDVYSAAEAMHGVDKTAAKMFMALRKLETHELLRTFRDLNGLCDAAGLLTQGADLVDKAKGNVVSFRMPDVAGAAGDGSPREDEDEDEEGGIDEEIDELTGDSDPKLNGGDDDFVESSEEELAAQVGRGATAAAKQRADAAMKAAPVPYTGDNSDLAGE